MAIIKYDPAIHKMGKLAPKPDIRTLRLAKYIGGVSIPPAKIIAPNCAWGMALNDTIGDCTIATVKHMIEVWSFLETGQQVTIPDPAVLAAYIAITGKEGAAYDPATGANDNGCAIMDVLRYWRNAGIGGDKIQVFVGIDPKNQKELQMAIWLFGAIDIGLGLPQTAMNQIGGIWSVKRKNRISFPDIKKHFRTGKAGNGSGGGHSIPLVGYDTESGLYAGVTWGAIQWITHGFIESYCDEAYAALSTLWVSKNDVSPQGFDTRQLLKDLQAV